MDIIGEVVAALLQLLFEAILQVIGELLAELGWHSVREAIRPSQPPRPVLGLIGFAIAGVVLGALSLWVFPKHFATSPALRLATLLFAPLMSALAAVLLAQALPRFFEEPTPRWRWANAYVFALAFALIRFAYAR